MATRLVHLVVDAANPAGLARFWAAALSWEAELDGLPDEAAAEPSGFSYPSPAALPLVFVLVSEPKLGKSRVHFDLATQTGEHQRELVQRLRDLGARPVDIGQGDVPWVVLADPEGNEFCVLEPREVYQDTGPVAAVVVDTADPVGLAGFWAEATGFGPHHRDADFTSLRSQHGTGPYLELLRGTDAKRGKNRIHLDVAPQPGDDHVAEVKRLEALGARLTDIGQGEVSWVVLADPEGNEFCVLKPR